MSISIGNLTIDSITLGDSDTTIYLGNVKIYEKAPTNVPYLTFSSPNSFTLKTTDSKKYWNGTLEYSTNTTTWSTWGGTTLYSGVSDNSNVLYLRGTGNTYITGSSGLKWVLTGSNISCLGNIENLLDYATVSLGSHPTMASYCYSNMFNGCTSLVSAPALLPATTLTSSCYQEMFRGCTSLTTPPALPATTLTDYCYYAMFYGCSSLTTTPALPATTLAYYCYLRMFKNCSSLYVSDTQTAQAQYAWEIPTNAVISGATREQVDVFTGCLGTRSSNDFAGASGSQYTYYTQNQPIL